uniref:Neurotransmitter-gated ion-channel ligand-binding domain-containing protein n=1 Tax=Anopheles minimus TaxID=112268 RepID=A0A182W8J6_9DIPT
TIKCDGESSSIEGKLLEKLLCVDYDKTQRPVKNHKTAVNVSMAMHLKEYYVNEMEPSLVMSVWMTLSWKDEFLTWDRADYGMETVNIDSSNLWRPTIETMRNKEAGSFEKSCNDHKCEVKHNGTVSCISPCTYEAHCSSTNVDWPFDQVLCTMYFSSWMEFATQINITADTNISREFLHEDRSWNLLSTETEALVPTREESFSMVLYTIILERHMGVYAAIMTPGFMVVVVSLAVLWIDSASSDRLHILCATCLGHYIYLEYIYWHLAYNTKDVPKILLFFRDSLLINVLTLIFTIVLRHTTPRKNTSERLIDRLALRAASTSLGCMLLQVDHTVDPKLSQRSWGENQTDPENNRHAENGANGTNGDTVNLVVDGYDGNNTSFTVSTKQHRTGLGIIFMDPTINCEASTDPLNKEGKLLRNLFCFNYDKSERPVKDHNTAVNVTSFMHVQNYDVDEGKSTLYLYVWMSISWKDEFLNWDRAEYGIDKLIVDSSEIWRPTFVAFHNLNSGNGDSACANHPCELKPSGIVLCVPPCQYEALCVSNTANWPFDSLKCTMFLGAWLEDVNQINISRKSNITTGDIEMSHAEWKLQSAELLHIFLPDNTSYPSLEYIVTLERHIAIYGVILTPGFLMIIINLAVLWMNIGSTERLYVLCATCMAHFTYMEYLYWRVPYHGENVPKLLLFFRDSLVINALMLAFTIILRHTAPKGDSSERFVDKLACKVASTSLGRLLLQTEDQNDNKQPGTTEGENAERGNANTLRSDSVDGETVNLVTDAPDRNASTLREASVEQQHAKVVIIFMDRIMFICFVLCYVFMVCGLLPKENI